MNIKSTEYLISSLKKIRCIYGDERPSYKFLYNLRGKHGTPSISTYTRRFGSFKKVLDIAGYPEPINRKKVFKKCFICDNDITTRAKKFCGIKCYLETKKKGICPYCGIKIFSSWKRCKDCRNRGLRKSGVYSLNRTLSDLKSKKKTDFSSIIRSHSRKIALDSGIKKECTLCGYNKVVQICHIKPVKDFPLSAKLSEVNNLKNLVLLCPNCHWEFDHGIIKL